MGWFLGIGLLVFNQHKVVIEWPYLEKFIFHPMGEFRKISKIRYDLLGKKIGGTVAQII